MGLGNIKLPTNARLLSNKVKDDKEQKEVIDAPPRHQEVVLMKARIHVKIIITEVREEREKGLQPFQNEGISAGSLFDKKKSGDVQLIR